MTFTAFSDRVSRFTMAWGLPLLVFVIPWGARVIFLQGTAHGAISEALTLSLFAVQVLTYLVVVGALPNLFAAPSTMPKNAEPLLLLSVMWALVSLIWAPAPDLALQAAVRLIAAALLLLLLVRVNDLGRVRDAFLLSAAVQAALAVFQLLTQTVSGSTILGVAGHLPFEAASVIESSAGRLLRAYGTLPHPNVLGGLLAAALVIALADTRTGRRRGIALAALSPLLAVGLVSTFSRSAWLAAAAGVAMLLFSAMRRHAPRAPFLLRLGGVVVAAAVMAALYSPYLQARVGIVGRLEERSLDERHFALEEARDLFYKHPVLGVGIGNVVPALAARSGSDAPLLEPPHMVPALILTELGVVGFALSTAFLLALFPRRRRIGPEAAALAAAGAVLILFDHYLWTSVPGLLFGALILALVASGRQDER